MHIKSLLVVSALTATMLAGTTTFADTTATAAEIPATEQPAPHHKHHKHKHKHHKHKHKHKHARQHAKHHAPYVSSACHNQHHCSNFLVGGEMAYARQKEKFTTRFSTTAARPIVQLGEHEEKISDNGVNVGLLLGWQYRWHRALLGIEGAVDWQDFDRPRAFMFSSPTTVQPIALGVNYPTLIYSGTAQYDRGPMLQLTTRAGYFVTPGFMPYVRFGAQVSRDEVNYQVFYTPATYNGGLGADFSSSDKKTVWGVVGGIGAEFPTFIGASTIRFEYTFTRSERIQIEDDTFPIFGTHKFHYPETNAIKVAWVWNFL